MIFDPIGIIPSEILDLITSYSNEDTFNNNKYIKLYKNENSLGSPVIQWFNRFPVYNPKPLLKKVAIIKNIEDGYLTVTNGTTEALQIILQLFCKPGKDNAIVCSPANGNYNNIIQLHHIELKKVNLTTDMMLDLEQMEQLVNANTKLIIIESPNSITGNSMLREDIEIILNNFKGIVLIDETYINFSKQKSFITELSDYKNLIVLQNFDIAWGLANLQVALLFGDKIITDLLHKISWRAGINKLVEDVLTDALDNVAMVNDMIKEIVQMRVALRKVFEKFPFVEKVFSSDANFLLIKVNDAEKLFLFMLQHNIIVKNLTNIDQCENCLRITIGSEEENTRLVECFVAYFDQVYQH